MRTFALILLFEAGQNFTVMSDSVASEATFAAVVGALLGLMTAPLVLRRSRDWAAFARFHEALARR